MSHQLIVAIGRESGSGGLDIAHALAERLQLPLFDKSILQKAAEDKGVSAQTLERYDERPYSPLFCRSVRGISSASELQNRIAASLLAVGLDPAVFLHRRRHELSGGECQRVALAARLALRPRVLLMDEPTASVDQQSAERIARAARHAADSGSAVVVVSHDHEWITPLSDRLVTLREGKLVE